MYDKPLPVIDAETRPFWDAAKAHKFVLQHCGDCGKYVHYPRAICPHCNGRNMDWRDASGEGEIYSFTVARRPAGPAFKEDVPYVIVLVDLKEGPRMLSNLVTDDVDGVRIGQRVKVMFDEVTDEITLPKFELA
ncbi:MAG: Zn-ribbon domain-containing OB-fold protein [SAR324 cluster bacterium]|nr:Zn-ribbon domain-containing OB-fold protein [SAR324 cluster bacterium]